MNKTNYKRITFGNIVNKSGITILIILIFSVNFYPAATLPIDNIVDGLPNTNHFSLDELNQIDLSWLHDQGYNGSNMKIGIMDNGIDFLHAAFVNINYTEKSFDTPEQQSTQTHGSPAHGVSWMIIFLDDPLQWPTVLHLINRESLEFLKKLVIEPFFTKT